MHVRDISSSLLPKYPNVYKHNVPPNVNVSMSPESKRGEISPEAHNNAAINVISFNIKKSLALEATIVSERRWAQVVGKTRLPVQNVVMFSMFAMSLMFVMFAIVIL